jgi:hypothetical protein
VKQWPVSESHMHVRLWLCIRSSTMCFSFWQYTGPMKMYASSGSLEKMIQQRQSSQEAARGKLLVELHQPGTH